MKSRIHRIIEELAKDFQPQKAKDLAWKLETSEKTIREDISQYWAFSENKKLEIVSDTSGYRLVLHDPECNVEELLDLMDATQKVDVNEQQLLLRLLSTENYVRLDDLAEEFYVSASTISRLFKAVKNTLNDFNLGIQSKPNYGIRIVGSEKDRRRCFTSCFSAQTKIQIDLFLDQCNLSFDEYATIDRVVSEELQKNDFSLTDMGYRNLLLHLSCAIARIRTGNYITSPGLVSSQMESEKLLARQIVARLEEAFGVKFPEEENEYIQIHLICKKTNFGNDECFVSASTEELLVQINERIKKRYGIGFHEDTELFAALSVHLEPMLFRASYGLRMPNPILKEIKTQFLSAYDCAVVAADTIQDLLQLSISEDEIGYLAIHYNLALERKKQRRKIHYYLVCTTGLGSAKFLEKKIQEQFHVQSKDIVLCSLYQLRNIQIQDEDFVFSTIRIPFAVKGRIVYIDNIFSTWSVRSQEKNLPDQIIRKELLFFDQRFTTKEQVLHFLCSQLDKTYSLPDFFEDLVFHREKLSSTDVGNYTALPHPEGMPTTDSIFAYCSLKKPITWHRHKVKFIFLISYAKKDLEMSHEFNEQLISKVMDTKKMTLLSDIHTPEDFILWLEGK